MIEYELIEAVHSLHLALKNRKTKGIYQLIAAMVLFNIGYYVFYASYVPFQTANGLSYFSVFVIQMLNTVAQIGIFLIVLEKLRKPTLHRDYVAATLLRAVSYAAILASMFLPIAFFYTINIFAYMLAGVALAFWNLRHPCSFTARSAARRRATTLAYGPGSWPLRRGRLRLHRA